MSSLSLSLSLLILLAACCNYCCLPPPPPDAIYVNGDELTSIFRLPQAEEAAETFVLNSHATFINSDNELFTPK